MSNYTERLMFDALGHVEGVTYYMRIIRRGDGKVWNPTTKALVAHDNISWVDSYTILVESGPTDEKTGVYPIVIEHDWRTVEDIAKEQYGRRLCDLTDAEKIIVGGLHQDISNIPAATYDVVVYKQESDSDGPDHEDNVERQFEVKIGDIFGF